MRDSPVTRLAYDDGHLGDAYWGARLRVRWGRGSGVIFARVRTRDSQPRYPLSQVRAIGLLVPINAFGGYSSMRGRRRAPVTDGKSNRMGFPFGGRRRGDGKNMAVDILPGQMSTMAR